jgi:hypothetical protein
LRKASIRSIQGGRAVWRCGYDRSGNAQPGACPAALRVGQAMPILYREAWRRGAIAEVRSGLWDGGGWAVEPTENGPYAREAGPTLSGEVYTSLRGSAPGAGTHRFGRPSSGVGGKGCCGPSAFIPFAARTAGIGSSALAAVGARTSHPSSPGWLLGPSRC